jgi:hypothetical protein
LTVVGNDPAMETPHESVWLRVRGWHKPRTRWFVAALACLLLLIPLIWALRWWTQYQPLEAGCCNARGHINGRMEYAWTIANRGSHTVRVTSVDDPSIEGTFTDARVFLGPKGEPGAATLSDPMHPFDLAPGEERAITVTGRVVCLSPEAGKTTIVQQRVHYTAFGLSHATWVPISRVPVRPPPGTCSPS